MSDRETRKRDQILTAALQLGLRVGPAQCTMEALAREARVAKPTLYRYYPDRDAVFTAVSHRLIDDLQAAFDSALSGDGTVTERLAAAFRAKHGTVANLLHGSPHADALYSENDRLAGPRTREMHAWVTDRIKAELTNAGATDADLLTTIIMTACDALMPLHLPAETIDQSTTLLIERLVTPSLPRA